METAKFGVLTISDRASRGEYEDISGKYIID
ncbi:MAG: molybdopterin adenylyltransferase, partial [Aquificaceae bacterium]|nr:molybdopterin adenylyltransferase [Aquificaceae bacterium]